MDTTSIATIYIAIMTTLVLIASLVTIGLVASIYVGLKVASGTLSRIEQVSMATLKASEMFLDSLENFAKDVPPTTYKTADGKHSANTIDEFIKKLEADPEYQALAEGIRKDLEAALGDEDDEPEEEF